MAQIWSAAGILSGFNVFKPSKCNRNTNFRKIQAEKPKYTVN